MQRAAGGTSQRLNPVLAMMRSRSSKPGLKTPPRIAWSIAAMDSSLFLPPRSSARARRRLHFGEERVCKAELVNQQTRLMLQSKKAIVRRPSIDP
jgi:hypothetical protein